MRRRESMDEREAKTGLGRSNRASNDEMRTSPPDLTDAARARGLHGQHVVDAYQPDLGNPRRHEPEDEAVEGRVAPEDLPTKRGTRSRRPET